MPIFWTPNRKESQEVARVMTEGEVVVLIVLNGKEGSGYAVRAESGLNELLPSILRRVAKLIWARRPIHFGQRELNRERLELPE